MIEQNQARYKPFFYQNLPLDWATPLPYPTEHTRAGEETGEEETGT